MRTLQLQQMFDEANPWGPWRTRKALYLDELTDGAIQVFTDTCREDIAASLVPVFFLGDGYARVPDDETAFGGSRKGPIRLQHQRRLPGSGTLRWRAQLGTLLLAGTPPHASGWGSY